MKRIKMQILHHADSMIYHEILLGALPLHHIKLKVVPMRMDVGQVFGMISARYLETLLMEILVM